MPLAWVEQLEIPDLVLLEPKVFTDSRGWFAETFREEELIAHGIDKRFVQDNHSHSMRCTLRGLHYQLRHPQAKLCRVATGEVLDVAVDIRRGSPTFGKSVTALLSAENQRQIYIPAGFAHGFLVLSESADFLYKCSDYYRADDDRGILWNDPELAIDWPLETPLLSEKDAGLPAMSAVPEESLPVYAGMGGGR